MAMEPDRRQLRASDSDREAVVEILRDAAADGRLTMEELDERVTAAYSARTYGDLEPLIADLPAGLPTPRAETLQLSAPFNDVRREGRWVVPPRIVATAGLGNVKLDFTDAVVRGREIVVEATAYAGDVVLVVPEGFAVDLSGVQAVVGSVKNKVQPGNPGTPEVRVVGRAVMGDIVARHPRRARFLPR